MLRFAAPVFILALVLSAACAGGTSSPQDWELDCTDCPIVFLDGQEPELVGGQGLEPDIDLRILGCTEEQTTLHKQFLFDSREGYVAAVIFTPLAPIGMTSGPASRWLESTTEERNSGGQCLGP